MAARLHILFSIVAGFLSLTMSPMVSSTDWLPEFFHQSAPSMCKFSGRA